MKFNNKKNIENARRTLIEVTAFLDNHNIPYQLEGGTLLGIIRDGDLLPWDHDLDISIKLEDAKDFNKTRIKFILKGYRVTCYKSKISKGPIKKGDYRIFKIKPLWKSLLKMVMPQLEDNYIVLDVFVKSSDSQHTYWQAMKKTLRVSQKHYTTTDQINFRGHTLKTPHDSADYLTAKYGNWKIAKKDWNCCQDEKTIID